MRNTRASCGLAVLAFMFALMAPAVTTVPVSVVPTVVQTVSIYDYDSMRVVSDNALTGSETTTQSSPFFARVAELVAAKRPVLCFRGHVSTNDK